MESPSTLKGKVAFVTGSTRGIGWATARKFAQHGATIIVHGQSSPETVEQRAAEIRSEFPVECIGLVSDVADASSVKRCYSEIFKKYRRLDVLVNNAGILQDALLGMIPEAVMRRTLEVNTLGPLFHVQEASRLMSRSGGGSIINMSSIIGRFGNEGEAVYATSKAAIIGLTLAAAKELAPKNIRVNAVAPGFIRTDLTSHLSPEVFAERVKSIKMKRVGEPEEVANVILFLASDLASYVTGQILGVDGGMLV
jgi:3-oxoacyl-[acyl-carrier protein] reductase